MQRQPTMVRSRYCTPVVDDKASLAPLVLVKKNHSSLPIKRPAAEMAWSAAGKEWMFLVN